MTTVALHGKEYQLAEPGKSGAVCRQCNANLTLTEAKKYLHRKCPHCKFTNWDALAVFEIRAMDSMKQFFSDEVVKESVWYHATTQQDWHSDVLNSDSSDLAEVFRVPEDTDFTVMVHLGTVDAALDRAGDLDRFFAGGGKNTSEITWYIHEVRLNSDAPLSKVVVENEDSNLPEYAFQAEAAHYDDGFSNFADKFEESGITRYINTYESTGSISLLANPKSFTVVNTIVV